MFGFRVLNLKIEGWLVLIFFCIFFLFRCEGILVLMFVGFFCFEVNCFCKKFGCFFNVGGFFLILIVKFFDWFILIRIWVVVEVILLIIGLIIICGCLLGNLRFFEFEVLYILLMEWRKDICVFCVVVFYFDCFCFGWWLLFVIRDDVLLFGFLFIFFIFDGIILCVICI